MNDISIVKRLSLNDIDDFLQGEKDCKAGKPHVNGSRSYNAGYEFRYEKEQRLTARQLSKGKNNE